MRKDKVVLPLIQKGKSMKNIMKRLAKKVKREKVHLALAKLDMEIKQRIRRKAARKVDKNTVGLCYGGKE